MAKNTIGSTDFTKERTIKYFGRDFDANKQDLINFSQAHHSGVLVDKNETSPFMAILELQAAVGDKLDFYMEQLFLELKQDSAREIGNVASFAKSKGYKPQGKTAARGIQSFVIEVPATTSRGRQVPDDSFAPTLKKDARVQGPNGSLFETLESINFATASVDSPRAITGSRYDSISGLPTHFAIKKEAEIVAGETKSDTFSVGDFDQFLQLELANEDVLEVIRVTDSDNNEWYEVDYLAQDTVFDQTANTGVDSETVPFVLKLLTVPRRFIVDRNVETNKSSLIFGSGDGVNFDDELVPNLADLALPLAGRRTFTSYPLDPQNFLKTRSLGLSPYNTTITVEYRVGGGNQTNVPPRSIDTVVSAELEFGSSGLNPLKKSDVINSLSTMNEKRTDGGSDQETVSEIKANSDAFFAAQNRCVTPEDYIARVLSLPARFGKPYKVYTKQTNNRINLNAVDLHVLTKDSNGHLTQATSTLTQNIKTYVKKYNGLGVPVNILQTDIINLKVYFGIVVAPKYNKSEILAKCLTVVADYLHVDKMQIGEPIVLSDLSSEIQKVLGVISVYDLRIVNIFCPDSTNEANNYSTTRFNVKANIKNNILLCPLDACFEIKAASDVIGVCK